MASRTLPAIVTVTTLGADSGTGSGAILSEDGAVVTNDHVIAPAVLDGRIEVQLASGERLPAELVGRDPQTDLAVLAITYERALPAIELGSSDGVNVGEPVVALGAPLGLSSTVTAGIVSATGCSVTVPTGDGTTTVLTGAVQTGASINPGNSGGALVDCRGRLVGVNTAISTVPDSAGQPVGGSVGIGFAVPVATVRAITDELITPRGSAEAAGLQVGDLVTRLDGREAPTEATLAQVTVEASDGDEVDVEFLRDSAAHRTTVTLRPDPEETPSGRP